MTPERRFQWSSFPSLWVLVKPIGQATLGKVVNQSNKPMVKVLISAQTTDTTSAGENIEGLSDIVVQFIRANHSSGNTVFSIDGSNDGTNWVTGIACQDLTATASATFVTGKTLSSATTAAVRVPDGFKMIRAVADVTTDGQNSVILSCSKKAVS